jgi:signal peptidase I
LADRLLDLFWRGVGPLARRWHLLRSRLASELPADLHDRNPWLAGALSIMPGGGQLYNHQPKKALLIFAVAGPMTALAVATLRHPLSNWILLAWLLVLIYGWHDAVMTAKQINRDPMTPQRRIALYCAWIFYICVLCLAFQFFGRHVLVRMFYIAHDHLVPTLNRGERIAVDVWSYLGREPAPGEVVLYDPPQIWMEDPTLTDRVMGYLARNAGRIDSYLAVGAAGGMVHSQNMMIIDPGNAIERIVAGPGETFERRDGVFYRNREPVPPDRQPLVQDQIPWNFQLVAPPDHYIILLSYTGSGFDPTTTGDSFIARAPRLDDAQWIVHGWEKACVVPREAIMGRVWLVYQPPEGRRLIR